MNGLMFNIVILFKRAKCSIFGHKFQKQIVFVLNPSASKGTGFMEVCQCCYKVKESA